MAIQTISRSASVSDHNQEKQKRTIFAPIYDEGPHQFRQFTLSQRREVLEFWTKLVQEHVFSKMLESISDEASRLDPNETERLISMLSDLIDEEDLTRAAFASSEELRKHLMASTLSTKESDVAREESYFYADKLARSWFDCIELELGKNGFLELNEALLPNDYVERPYWSTLVSSMSEFPLSTEVIESSLKAVADNIALEPFDELPVLQDTYTVFQAPDDHNCVYVAVNLEKHNHPARIAKLVEAFEATNSWVKELWKPFEKLADEMESRSLSTCDLNEDLMPTSAELELSDPQSFLGMVSKYNRLPIDVYKTYINEGISRVKRVAQATFKDDMLLPHPRSQRHHICISIREAKHKLIVGDNVENGDSFVEAWRTYNAFCPYSKQFIAALTQTSTKNSSLR